LNPSPYSIIGALFTACFPMFANLLQRYKFFGDSASLFPINFWVFSNC